MDTKRVVPDLVSSVDGDHTNVTVDIILPGVEAKDIHVRIRDDKLSLRAKHDDLEYETTFEFCCAVDHRDAKARLLSDGLFRIEAPFREPMVDAVDMVVGNRAYRSRNRGDLRYDPDSNMIPPTRY